MFGREPAIIAGALAGIIQGILLFAGIEVPENLEGMLLILVTLLAAVFVRAKVMPVKTINQAGLTTDTVQARADNPGIAPVKEAA